MLVHDWTKCSTELQLWLELVFNYRVFFTQGTVSPQIAKTRGNHCHFHVDGLHCEFQLLYLRKAIVISQICMVMSIDSGVFMVMS